MWFTVCCGACCAWGITLLVATPGSSKDVLCCPAQCCSSFYLGNGVIQTLATSTTEVAEPFLLPEMVQRIANTLNYFLLYLTGPNRKMLKVRPLPTLSSCKLCMILEYSMAAER